MKTLANVALRELRRMIGRTQGEFAAMIGASKDAVASWETGRNRLSEPFARRIALATGVEAKGLLRGRSSLKSYVPFKGRMPFSQEAFERHRDTYWGRTDEAAARRHLRNCVEALELIFVAAARPRGRVRHRLPGVVDSFIQWCERTREDFLLGQEIETQLRQRKAKLVINHTYGEWRRMQKEDPEACRLMGFKDDPRKRDSENLRLEAETVPVWMPGRSMRGIANKPQDSRDRFS
ncbi:MAG TPA: helix-turn-helix transcriptional regulator [Verrucomicrobiota bacterium]|nr:helix-turn-helix transcriptional regulator [Verrucomicrobiota bacterium]HQL80482.1 helix-turn-helix transcriptional regulator [Verrucomicrobiota bacterium]